MFTALLNLTKPRISLLFAISGLTALLVEGSFLASPLRLWTIVVAIFLVGGSANGFNQYFEREIDLRMERTAKKRPLPLQQVTPRTALLFSILLGIIGCWLLWEVGGLLAFLFGLGTILYYSFFYTLYLKPRTPYNIVIGGIAGATGPLIAWAAATGTIHWIPFLIFLLIVFWTPPHFWALALYCKEDYAKVGLPMLPNVAGDEATRKQILLYSISLLPISLLLASFEPLGRLFLFSALILNALFIALAAKLFLARTDRAAKTLFAYSILYLFLFLVAVMVDS